MLKKMLEIIMVALIVVGAAGAYFKWVGALPISVTQTQKTSTFDATGEGKVVVVPDQATVSMGVQEQGFNLKQVQEQVNKKMANLSKSLKDLGVSEKDIKTTGFSYYPDYQERNRYTAYATVTVTIRDMESVSPVMDLVGTLGLDNVSGPSFGLSDELAEKTTKEARMIAIDKAKKKAEELAGLAGMRLGRIVNVVEVGGNVPQPYMMRDSLTISAVPEQAKTPTPIERGTSDVIVNIVISYETL